MLLSLKTRKTILKIPFAKELASLFINCSNSIFYKKLSKEKGFEEKLLSLKNSYVGERCFIVGNGPSLSFEQLKMIENEFSFAANRIYKVFGETAWRPTFYVIQDRYDNSKSIYDSLEVDKLFISDSFWKEHGINNEKAICFHTIRQFRDKDALRFSDCIDKEVFVSYTVTYSMIQMACYMGFSEIYLIGMDHRYANEVDSKNNIIRTNNIRSHIFNDDTGHVVTANIQGMEKGYSRAKEYCDKHGITIRNATIGGYLEVFERIDFYSLFGQNTDF